MYPKPQNCIQNLTSRYINHDCTQRVNDVSLRSRHGGPCLQSAFRELQRSRLRQVFTTVFNLSCFGSFDILLLSDIAVVHGGPRPRTAMRRKNGALIRFLRRLHVRGVDYMMRAAQIVNASTATSQRYRNSPDTASGTPNQYGWLTRTQILQQSSLVTCRLCNVTAYHLRIRVSTKVRMSGLLPAMDAGKVIGSGTLISQ